MKSSLNDQPEQTVCARRWLIRILVLAVLATLVLTLYPFQFEFGRHLTRPLSPFSLGGWTGDGSLVDIFLNVLLFVPYGFAIAGIMLKRGRSKATALRFALVAGVLLSYTIELLQLYLPRDSGWEDVLSNSIGSALGALAFLFAGEWSLNLLFGIECRFRAWLEPRRGNDGPG